jgi:NAD-dependent dihydropyrimidine dehydrogenase PreA subunit
MAQLIYLKDVVTLKLDQDKCVGCGMCLLVCPRDVFSLAHAKIEVKGRDACIERGACVQHCPAGALSVRSGVGCATAVINAALGRKSRSCCCTIDTKGPSDDLAGSSSNNRPGCC